MKVAWLLLATVVVATNASIISTTSPVRQTDDVWVDKQTKVINLLSWGKMKEAYENEYYDWDIEHQSQHFTDQEVFRKFMRYYKSGFIPREAPFNLYSTQARNQSITLFELFYSAKDFDTFYKTASWARKHVNFGAFAYAFSIAVFNRPDCKGLEIPPLYEIFPNYFIPADFIHKTYKAKMYDNHSWQGKLNYTGYYYNYHKDSYGGIMKQWQEGNKYGEYKLSYFREDVALNDYYARWFLHYPTWFNTQKHHLPQWHRRGELFYYFHQQLFARYVLERFANDLPTVDMLSWEKPIKVGYNPNMISFNGIPLAIRPDYFSLKYYYPYGVWDTKRAEHKLLDTIDSQMFYYENGTLGSFKHLEGTDLLGKAFAGIPSVVNRHYYKYYFYSALNTLAYAGKTNTDKHYIGGPTSHLLTTVRDPAFYQYLHRMLKHFQIYKSYLPYYGRHELEYPGVKLENFEVSKLTTYFDYFDFDVTYGLGMSKSEHKNDYHYVAKQLRINHKPFTYKFTVASHKTEDAMIRVFIGPKYDSEGHELSIEQARMAYFEIDRFPVKLQDGENTFTRNSHESTVFVKDFTSTRTFKDYITKYTKNYPTYQEGHHCGFPEHFQLPKGKQGGKTYVMYAIVTPYTEKYTPKPEEKYYDAFVTCGGSKFYDYKPYGYPFDRVIPYEQEFYTRNMIFKDVEIYHKNDGDFAFVSHNEHTHPSTSSDYVVTA